MWQRKVLVAAAVCIGKPPPLFGPLWRRRNEFKEHIYDRRCDRQSTDAVVSPSADFSRLYDSVQRSGRDIRVATAARMVKKIFSACRQGVHVKSILDRAFRYTPSVQTDLKKTFARIRREQRGQIRTNRTGTQAATETRTKVVPMRQHKTEMAESQRMASGKP